MVESQSFFIDGPQGQIEAKNSEPSTENSNKISVIICHPHPLYGGTMENKVVTTMFRTFKELGAYVLRFNYRGVGKSAGSYGATIGEIDDLTAVCDWVKKKRPDDKIWLAGFSFGSFIAASCANKLHAQQLLTIAPAVEHFNFDSIEYPKCPWLVIQGDADEVVPPQLVFDWVDKQPTPPKLVRYEGTGHFFHGRLTDLKNTIKENYAANTL